tara:strand:+ start:69 stop:221 length:153 start_codon:yes stop_codon:yes gene_type:complete
MSSNQKGVNFSIPPVAAAELISQSTFSGTPGVMNIDFIEDSCKKGRLHSK